MSSSTFGALLFLRPALVPIPSRLGGHDELFVAATRDRLPLGHVADAGDCLAAAVQPHVTVVRHLDESES